MQPRSGATICAFEREDWSHLDYDTRRQKIMHLCATILASSTSSREVHFGEYVTIELNGYFGNRMPRIVPEEGSDDFLREKGWHFSCSAKTRLDCIRMHFRRLDEFEFI